MKLYTEEQVRKALVLKSDIKYITYSDDNIVDSLTPIELPSDEEIEKAATHLEPSVTRRAFQSGAKWMKEQILNQNK